MTLLIKSWGTENMAIIYYFVIVTNEKQRRLGAMHYFWVVFNRFMIKEPTNDICYFQSQYWLEYFIAHRYGGKFGVQSDRMDKSAVGHDYVAKSEKHVSQKDYSQGKATCFLADHYWHFIVSL